MSEDAQTLMDPPPIHLNGDGAGSPAALSPEMTARADRLNESQRKLGRQVLSWCCVIVAAALMLIGGAGAALWDGLGVLAVPLFAAGSLTAAAATAAVSRNSSRHSDSAVGLQRDWDRARAACLKQQDLEDSVIQIVEHVCSQGTVNATFVELFRLLIPRAREGWAAFFDFHFHRDAVVHCRGLSPSARRNLTLPTEFAEHCRDAAYCRFPEQDVRRSEFRHSLNSEDRRKTHTLHAFRIGNADNPRGVVIVTNPFPALRKHENAVEGTQETFAGINTHLTSLLEAEADRAGFDFQAKSDEGHDEYTTAELLARLRELLDAERASVLTWADENSAPQVLVSDGPVLPPGIDRVWQQHEAALAEATGKDIAYLDAPALAEHGVSTLVSSAAIAPIPNDGGHRLALVMTRRGDWPHRPTDAVYISGCCECLAERLSRTSTASPGKRKSAKKDAREEFLAVMSHELRTPVSAILGMTQLALEADIAPEQRQYLSLVQSSSESMMTMLDGVLDLAKIEAGELELEQIPFDLPTTVGETLKAVAFKVHERGLDFCLKIDPQVPDIVVGDPTRLRQVLVNLVGNAAKFTEQGEIVVNVALQAQTASVCLLRFEVRDTGVGIAPEAQDKIFSKYAQADASVTRRFGGTGLGLAISQQIVESMAGEIGVDSETGQGSTFYFTAAFGLTSDAPPRSQQLPDSRLDHRRSRNHARRVAGDRGSRRRRSPPDADRRRGDRVSRGNGIVSGQSGDCARCGTS